MGKEYILALYSNTDLSEKDSDIPVFYKYSWYLPDEFFDHFDIDKNITSQQKLEVKKLLDFSTELISLISANNYSDCEQLFVPISGILCLVEFIDYIYHNQIYEFFYLTYN